MLYFTTTRSSQPQRRGRPVVTPNSRPARWRFSPTSLAYRTTVSVLGILKLGTGRGRKERTNVQLLRWKGPAAHACRIRLNHADDLLHRKWRQSQTVEHATNARVR